MTTPAVERRPASTTAELAEVRDDLNHLLMYSDDVIVDGTIIKVLAAIDAILARVKAEPERRWSRIGLMSSAGALVSALFPSGAWPTLSPRNALTWADVEEYESWRAEQSESALARLDADGWRLCHLDTVATPIVEAKT